MSKDDKIKHSKYLLNLLFPFLEQFDHEQKMEREIEAKSQGITSPSFAVNEYSCFHVTLLPLGDLILWSISLG